ncbi:hypothetical protein P43SY_008723 [Pythium insidiosum]|uniref:Uncharacterized protein n=1 Tax=Pythium insidiosum TaxID=114742 RepID=A0AAD5LUS3_PYTIN|nr:hypothetical protein P43SY_008723 [Pythium insidiosum]
MTVVEAADRSRLQAALSSLAAASAPQDVYSSLAEIEGVLVAAQTRPDVLQRLVTVCLAPSHVVRQLLEIAESYVSHEEIVCCMCHVVEVATRTSRRLQGELGLICWWRVLFDARSQHSESPRVLLASLRCEHALLANCELLQLQATTQFAALIDEKLQLIDRFTAAPSRRETEVAPHQDRRSVVVESLRVLSALFASSRVAKSSEATATAVSSGILTRLESCVCVAVGRDAAQLWLRVVCAQLQQHPRAAFQALASSSGLAGILAQWRDDPEIIVDVCSVLSTAFPVASGPSSRALGDALSAVDLDAAVRGFVGDSSLIATLCECFAALRPTVASASDERRRLARHDLTRVLRQLSAVSSIAALLPAVSTVKTALLPSVVQEIRETAERVGVRNLDELGCSDRELRQFLELLLLTARLLACPALSSAWSKAGAGEMELELGKLRKRTSVFVVKTNGSDSSTLSLVNQALGDVLALCRSARFAATPSSAARGPTSRKPQSSAQHTLSLSRVVTVKTALHSKRRSASRVDSS